MDRLLCDEYMAIAAGLAADGEALAYTRKALAEAVRGSPLGDLRRYAKGFAALCGGSPLVWNRSARERRQDRNAFRPFERRKPTWPRV